jgi:single-stranded-DNA-specific exonuclease
MRSVDAERIGFAIGPRLNAAGRVDDASTAYRLLMTENVIEARDLAQKIEAQNRRRQAIMNSVVEQARERARRLGVDV